MRNNEVVAGIRGNAIIETRCRTLHLIVGNSKAGGVFFACEQAPLMTFQSHGLPSRCPVCNSQNPLGATNR
jgi:ssDNA-binding Zn-finger/Zn-ribbon topoisomerase 1